MKEVLTRFPKWLWLMLTAICGFGAAGAFVLYLANGIVVGDLFGLPGRQHDIATAQLRSEIALFSCIVLQFGSAAALFRCTEGEGSYVAGRVLLAVLLSLVLTIVCGFAITLVFKGHV